MAPSQNVAGVDRNETMDPHKKCSLAARPMPADFTLSAAREYSAPGSNGENNMTTEQIAARLVELCRKGEYEQAQKELYADDAESVEAPGAPQGPLGNVK